MPYNPAAAETSPAAIRTLLTKTAEDRGSVGYDFECGWGIVNGCGLAEIYSEKEEPNPKKPKKIRCKIVRYKKVRCKPEIELECECLCTDDDSNCKHDGG